MSIGQVIRETRTEFQLSLQSLASQLYIGKSSLSEYERGELPTPPEVLSGLTKTIDSHRLCMAVAEEVTGGLYGAVWLDGDVDLHRTSVWAKTQEELEEAIEALKAAKIISPPKTINDRQREIIFESLLQALDARVAIDHYLDVICREYEFSATEVKEKHRQKLESRGYVKPRTKFRKETVYKVVR